MLNANIGKMTLISLNNFQHVRNYFRIAECRNRENEINFREEFPTCSNTFLSSFRQEFQFSWTLKALQQQTRNHNSSDWMKVWLENADLHEKPQIESSTSDTFDDDWSLGDNKLFRPYDFQDTEI